MKACRTVCAQIATVQKNWFAGVKVDERPQNTRVGTGKHASEDAGMRHCGDGRGGVFARTITPNLHEFVGYNTGENATISRDALSKLLQDVSRTPGVGQAFLFGRLDYSMRIWFQTDRLTALGLTPDDVVNAIRAQNQVAPLGRALAATTGATLELTIEQQLQHIVERELEAGVHENGAAGGSCRISLSTISA